jgi:hypothetical protein
MTIKMNPLPKTGYYAMRVDINNPKPDRRSKSWHLQPVLAQRRVYVQVMPDHVRTDALAEVGKTGPAHFRVELGVGYDRLTWYIDEDGNVVTDLSGDDRLTISAVIMAWNAAVFTFDASIASHMRVLVKERSLDLPDLIEEIVNRGWIERKSLDAVADLVIARAEAEWEEEERQLAAKREAQLRERET